VEVLTGHRDVVAGIAITSDGRRVVSGSWDRTVRIWDRMTGGEPACLTHETEVLSLAVDAGSGSIVAGTSDGMITVWDLEAGHRKGAFKAHRGQVTGLTLSPDGSMLVSVGSDGMIRVWNHEGCVREFGGLLDRLSSVSLTPEPAHLLTGSWDGWVRRWDLENGRETGWWGHDEPVSGVAASRDGRSIISACWDETIRIWDAIQSRREEPRASPSVVRELRGHTGLVTDSVFDHDGSRVWTCGEDATVRLWDLASGVELAVLNMNDPGPTVSALHLSSDGRRIGCLASSIHLWDTESGARLGSVTTASHVATCMALTPDGRRVVWGDSGGTIRVSEVETGSQLFAAEAHPAKVFYLRLAADGRSVISLGLDGLRVWDIESMALRATLRGHFSAFTSCAGGTSAIIACERNTIRTWDGCTFAELGQLLISDDVARCSELASSSDGKRIVTAGGVRTAYWCGNGPVKVWDAVTGECLQAIDGFADAAALAAGPSRYPWLAVLKAAEITIQDSRTHVPAAWYPGRFEYLCTAPSGNVWVGRRKQHFEILGLEGLG
jgi:WD40 repeat protein